MGECLTQLASSDLSGCVSLLLADQGRAEASPCDHRAACAGAARTEGTLAALALFPEVTSASFSGSLSAHFIPAPIQNGAIRAFLWWGAIMLSTTRSTFAVLEKKKNKEERHENASSKRLHLDVVVFLSFPVSNLRNVSR